MPSILPDVTLPQGGVRQSPLCHRRSMAIFGALCTLYASCVWAAEIGVTPSSQASSSKAASSKITEEALSSTLMGDSVEAVMPWAEESKMGSKVFYQFRQSGMWLEDPEIDSYLQKLVDKLRPRDGVWATRRIRAKAVNDPGVNAFALPGGYIGVNIGLLRRVDSESELASVLAHELSHVSQRHVVRMMESQPNQLLWLLGGILVAAASAKQGNGQAAQGAVMAGAAAGAQQQLAFTQSFEREADAIGLQRMEGSGFDPAAMYSMLRGLQRQIHGSQLPPYLRTHPLESERMALIEDRLKEVPYKQYVSSPDFLMVRALASSYNDTAGEAVERQRKLFETRQYSDERAARYAWAAALLRADHYAEAEKVIEPLYRQWSHPMVTSLYALSLSKQQHYERALAIYRTALGTWPQSEQLAYDYAEALRASGQPQAALTFLETTIRRMPEFTVGWKVAAESAAALGKKSDQHRYEAQYLAYYLGQWPAALERIQWALDSASTWQDRAVLQSLQHTLKKRAKDEE